VVGGARGEVARYASLLPDSGGPVLVLGVAEGRLAEALVRRGVPVTGVDPSPRMLVRAEETRAGLPPDLQPRLQLVRADLRSLRLAQRFVAVFAPRDAVALVDCDWSSKADSGSGVGATIARGASWDEDCASAVFDQNKRAKAIAA